MLKDTFPGVCCCAFAFLVMMSPAGAHAVQTADQLLFNGKIYTVNDQAPWADTVAIAGDTILYVGDRAGAEPFLGAATQTIDLAGQMVLPGFIDSHIHIGDTLPYQFAAALSPDMSAAEVITAIRTHAAAFPEQNPVVGNGFLGAAFGPQGPTAADLDAAVADRPAIMFDEGFHSAWINSRAMAAVGLTAQSPDPVPGAHYYRRYPDGTPTGWLIEGAAFGWISEALGVITTQGLQAGAERFFRELASRGITAAFDAGVIGGGELTWDFFAARMRQGALPLRIVGSHYVNNPRSLATALVRLETLHARFHDEFFDVRVLKISLDGTVEAQTAYTLQPYLEPVGHRADPLVPIGETSEVVAAAAAGNVDVHLHAIGDGAVRMALDMVELARREHPRSDSRFTICHAQVVNPADIPRFGELDVIVQSTPTWYVYDELALAYLGAQRLTHHYPLRSIAAAGARITLGSDYPASWIGLDGLDPLYNIEMALTRQPAGDRDFPLQPPANERITLPQAIRAYTLDAAWQLRLENEIGSIEPGKQADLVVLNHNLFDLAPHAIHTARVVLTMVDGRLVYRGD